MGKKNYRVDYPIRNALPSDYSGYSKLVIYMYESFKRFDENIYNGTEVVYSEGYYLSQLCEPNCFHLVCEIDNEIAGICIIDEDSDGMNIHTVSVAEKHAKKGVATSLYHSAFNLTREKGHSEVTATVFAQNHASRKFHEHMLMRPTKYRYVFSGNP